MQELLRRCPGRCRSLARCLCPAVPFRGCWFVHCQSCSSLGKTLGCYLAQSYKLESRISAYFSSPRLFDALSVTDVSLEEHQNTQIGILIEERTRSCFMVAAPATRLQILKKRMGSGPRLNAFALRVYIARIYPKTSAIGLRHRMKLSGTPRCRKWG